jgi:hypothetical protein
MQCPSIFLCQQLKQMMQFRKRIIRMSVSVFIISCSKEGTKQKNEDECVYAASITNNSSAQEDMQLLNKLWDEIYVCQVQLPASVPIVGAL